MEPATHGTDGADHKPIPRVSAIFVAAFSKEHVDKCLAWIMSYLGWWRQ